MERVGVIVKPDSSKAEDVARRVVKALVERGVEPVIEETSRAKYPTLRDYKPFSLEDPPEKVIVIGGDGTLLRAVMFLGRPDATIMTVRAGKRGFLLDVEPYEVEDRVHDFLEGNYVLKEYMRLEVRPPQHKRTCVLNDAVFISNKSKLVSLSVDVDGQRAMNLDGDGVIIATTAGSTAYSLSAGGPIVDPNMDVILITPLNPVQLHLRPIVTRADSTVRVIISHSSNPLYLSLDGQIVIDILPGDIVSIQKCPRPARIARFKWWESHFEKIYTRIYSYI
ncbi:MAG: NAD(+)/NADH kinase [Desulfurococcales archaeon]|nr:NAD(+)/NADH kinase [Desulfurococcales archaeon]